MLARETASDLLRICANPEEARRYFVVIGRDEIVENEFNLNLPRYVNTFDPEEKIEIAEALAALDLAETRSADKTALLKSLLRTT